MQKLELSNPERLRASILSYFNKNEEAKFIHRLHAILLKLENKNRSSDDIAGLFGQTGKIVSVWINKVNQSGDINVLRDKSKPGRTSRLSEEQEAEIRQRLQLSPEKSGVDSNLWDGKSLSYYIENQYGICLGVRQCQRLFHKLGFSLKRARPTVSKADEAKKEVSKKNFVKKQKAVIMRYISKTNVILNKPFR